MPIQRGKWFQHGTGTVLSGVGLSNESVTSTMSRGPWPRFTYGYYSVLFCMANSRPLPSSFWEGLRTSSRSSSRVVKSPEARRGGLRLRTMAGDQRGNASKAKWFLRAPPPWLVASP